MRRSFHIVAALAATGLLLGACGKKAGNEVAANVVPPAASESWANSVHREMTNAAAVNPPIFAASSFPSDFPSRDRNANGADCYVYLAMAMQAPGNASGYDATVMGQARDQWRADLRLRLSETVTQQLIASNINPLADTPAGQRDAAAWWCVEHAPVVDPA